MNSLQQATDPAPQTQQATAPQPQQSNPDSKTAPAAAAETEPGKIAAPPAKPATGLVDDKTYVIGPEDQLMVTVWGDQRLSGALMVRPDGRVSMNLIGELVAAGKTPEQLAKDIEDLLKEKEILRRPQVNVSVTSVLSKKYMINGEVLKPGPNPLLVPTTVLEALVNAGGFKDFANKKKIEVIRGNQHFRFNWNEVIKGKNPKQNILLQPGDLIIVP